jgi:hypothetical protein
MRMGTVMHKKQTGLLWKSLSTAFGVPVKYTVHCFSASHKFLVDHNLLKKDKRERGGERERERKAININSILNCHKTS